MIKLVTYCVQRSTGPLGRAAAAHGPDHHDDRADYDDDVCCLARVYRRQLGVYVQPDLDRDPDAQHYNAGELEGRTGGRCIHDMT